MVLGHGFQAHLHTLESTHWDIVNSVGKFGRGIYLFCLDDSEREWKNKTFIVEFHFPSDFYIDNESNEELIKNKQVADSIRSYDFSYQYMIMVAFNEEIIGGGFIPLHDYRVLKNTIDEAILAYENG